MRRETAELALQRARGRGEVTVVRRDGRIALDRLYQQGCAKAILPRTMAPVPEVVLINTSGGVTGGDRLDWRLDGRRRAGRSSPPPRPPSGSTARRAVPPASRPAWRQAPAPASTGCRRKRSSSTPAASTAASRPTSPPTPASRCRDRHPRPRRHGRARRDRRPLRPVAPPPRRPPRPRRGALRRGRLARATAGPATLAGARAFATLVHLAPGAETRLDAARALLADLPGVDGRGHRQARHPDRPLPAAEATPLRAGLIRFLMAFRAAPLPRVWHSEDG